MTNGEGGKYRRGREHVGGGGESGSSTRGGIAPAQSASGGKEARDRHLGIVRLADSRGFDSSEKRGVHLSRGWDPGAVAVSVRMMSPRAQRLRRAEGVFACSQIPPAANSKGDVAAHSAVHSPCAEPTTPVAYRTPHHLRQSSPARLAGTPDVAASPTAIALFQKYFTYSPSRSPAFDLGLDDGSEAPSPVSPGGVARAQRRPALHAKSRFGPSHGGHHSPARSIGGSSSSPQSPFVVRSVAGTEISPGYLAYAASPGDYDWSPGSQDEATSSQVERGAAQCCTLPHEVQALTSVQTSSQYTRSPVMDEGDEFGDELATELLPDFDEGNLPPWQQLFYAAKVRGFRSQG